MQTKEKRTGTSTRLRQGGGVQTAKKRKKLEPDNIVYTQPQPFNRNRFLLRLLTVFAVALAMVLGMAIFFKVENVNVSGAEKYSAWDIRQASQIQDGENLLLLSDAKISGRIITALPYVKQVRVGIKLPDTVNIEIMELDVVYAAEATDGSWWLISADGRVVDSVNVAQARTHTQILGLQLDAPQIGQSAVAAEPVPETVEGPEEANGLQQTLPVIVKGSERLSVAIAILQSLESNGFIGDMASVDVSSLSSVELWYGERFQINLGDQTQLDYKMSALRSTIDSPEMGEYNRGMLDVSFTTWPDMVGYTPFYS